VIFYYLHTFRYIDIWWDQPFLKNYTSPKINKYWSSVDIWSKIWFNQVCWTCSNWVNRGKFGFLYNTKNKCLCQWVNKILLCSNIIIRIKLQTVIYLVAKCSIFLFKKNNLILCIINVVVMVYFYCVVKICLMYTRNNIINTIMYWIYFCKYLELDIPIKLRLALVNKK